MKVDNIDIEELLLDESFINYCNQSSAKDMAYWEQYLVANPAQTELLQNAKDAYFQLFNSLATIDLQEAVNRLNTSISVSPVTPVIKMENAGKRRWSSFFTLKIKIAASAILLICASVLLYQYHTKNNLNNFKTFQAAYGERKNLQLPDGSFVTLNAGSSIKIKNDFGVSNRDVCLQGEAFFDVKHNSKLPFIVHTHAMDIKAVGTAFNVKAYKNEPITETSLIKGTVEVTLKENHNLKMLLYPNEKVQWKSTFTEKDKTTEAGVKKSIEVKEVSKLKQKIVTANDGTINEIAWKADRLVFEDERFDEIAMLLERWYAVKINFKDNDVRNYRFTGIFEKEELKTVLEFLKESRGFNYSMESGESLTINISK